MWTANDIKLGNGHELRIEKDLVRVWSHLGAKWYYMPSAMRFYHDGQPIDESEYKRLLEEVMAECA